MLDERLIVSRPASVHHDLDSYMRKRLDSFRGGLPAAIQHGCNFAQVRDAFSIEVLSDSVLDRGPFSAAGGLGPRTRDAEYLYRKER